MRAASVIAVLALVAACGTPPPAPRSFPDANVVLIGVDTLRADHVGCYGYRRPTSPRLDALCERSVAFESAVSQSPWTLPAFASMLTGRLPSSHRAGEGAMMNVSSLAPGSETLAVVLQRAGYRTGSFVSNGYVGRDVGLAQGFVDHQAFFAAAGAVRGALQWLDAHGREKFFLFLHIVDPHSPYTPTAEDAAPFIDRSYTGPVGMAYGGFGDPSWNARDRQRVIDLYDGEVRYADRLIGQVLDRLAALGVEGRTVVIVTSDHGEELFERGTLGHGHTLYDELLMVPLVVHLPGGTPAGRVRQQVRTMDVFPTVLDVLGLPVPSGLDAETLWPLARGEGGADRPALAEYLRVLPERKALRADGRKLVLTPTDGTVQLFDLGRDPGESRDVAPSRPDEALSLRARIEAHLLARLEGFHLLVRGGTAAHTVRAEFRSDRPMHSVGLYNPEEADRFTLSADGRALDVDLQLAARRPMPAFKLEVDDDDGVRFATTDGAAVTARLLLDGAPVDPAHLVLGAGGVAAADAPWRFERADARLRVPFPVVPARAADGGVRAVLVYVERPPPPVAALDEQTRENLRALGYIQ